MKFVWSLIVLVMVFGAGPASAKVDLVTLPERDTVQLTIYNSADMTLVREKRRLTLKNGQNRLQFSWADTLIDPTSLELALQAQADRIHVMDLTYPPRVRNLGLWSIQSEFSGEVPVEISYLTSGLTWRAFYMGTLAPDEAAMELKGYVVVSNRSGEDYENAQTRLVVGKVHLLDEIAALARREYPYGRPGAVVRPDTGMAADEAEEPREEMVKAKRAMARLAPPRKKEIKKEGLSEYFLYTIEGTETIPHTWSKRLPGFEAASVPVINLYKHDESRYGRSVVRFLSFKNDKEHKLGHTPIPGGALKVYRAVDDSGALSYVGASGFKYIPVGEDVELNLGPVADVVVEPKLMDFKTDNFMFDHKGDVDGWDEVRKYTVEVKNTRGLPVKVEIRRAFGTSHWDLKNQGDVGVYEKVDVRTVKYTLMLPARSNEKFTYILTTHHGRRAE